jgi:protoporphyrinogen oxidase
MNDLGKVLILGAGPTGLGAAFRLQEAGYSDFTVLEARSTPGGLASSHVDPHGYLWDIGGHVQFSHYRYYDAVLDRALGDNWLSHNRESWVWIRNRFVPYPFQYNLHRLDPADCERALLGLETAASRVRNAGPRDLRQWIGDTFGEGIAELFMVPYNEKVWGYPLHELSATWIGDRVAVPDLERVKRNVRERRDEVSWGPNNQFRFPLRGGTGAIWIGVGNLIDARRLRLGCRVVRVDAGQRRVQLASGETLGYDHLVTSLPLDRFCALCPDLDPRLQAAAAKLRHSSCHILGIGLRGPKPSALNTKCWMYFPEANSPYYRVTVFSHYSPHNVPAGDGNWSLMAEVCETPHKPVDPESLREATLRAIQEDGLISADSELVSFWQHREEYGYPTPFLERDAVLEALLPGLENLRIYSRGRFGAWRYEVSNQDHSFMQGVELVQRLLGSGEEVTYLDPVRANSGEFLR